MSQPKRVLVVGAGVIGLSCAHAIVSAPDISPSVQLTVLASSLDESSTTSFGSAGLWKPNLIENTAQDKVFEWGRKTFEYLLYLYYSDCAAEAGISLQQAYHIFETVQDTADPFWKDVVLDFKRLSKEHLRKLQLPDMYVDGYSYTTLTVQQSIYLPFLMKTLRAHNVTFIEKKINSLEEFLQSYTSSSSSSSTTRSSAYDVVINCTGLGAYSMVNDTTMFPIRGVVVRLKAPHIKSIWFFGDSYIIPNCTNVVVGGSADRGVWDLTVTSQEQEMIVDKASALFPSLRSAEVEGVWCGLRPGRNEVRLEMKRMIDGSGTGMPVVHCYGHGGCGVTLSWGCALEVLNTHIRPLLVMRPDMHE